MFKGAAILALLLTVALLAGLGLRALRQHQIARQLAITTPNGIVEEGFVPLGGIRQWVQIRGEDRRNPVLLIVHGGPGVSLMAYTMLFRGWEKHFTVVQWDQRGDGKTFGANPRPALADMQIPRVARDGAELADYLRRKFHKQRIILLGHSWGGAVALEMVHARPDLFSAFAATGFIVAQLPDWQSGFRLLLDRARQDGNAQAVAELTAIGPPPWNRRGPGRIREKWLSYYDHRAEHHLVRRAWHRALLAPNYSLKDIWDFFAAIRFSEQTAGKWLYDFDARRLGAHIAVPVFFLEGDRDFTTPIPIVRQYFDGLAAPRKDFIVLPGSGHSALLTDPDMIGGILVNRVRPLALSAD